ncbi:hypothetical protein [Burkholderia cepacia]|uniref:hypothetical protein n=1 Tax=Burkholderia cepacia TaxID=292 RepID=UPI002AB78A93|nr:hypothetical protein [Burkholderia cepacia]
MRQLYGPNGKKIVGTSDTVPVTSYVYGWENNGTPIYDGDDSKVHWDGLDTRKDGAGVIYVVDSSGAEHLFSDCVLRDA